VIVLDTNVISEIMRKQPSEKVLAWLRLQPPMQVYTTIMSKAEVLYGIACLDMGRKTTQLMQAAENIYRDVFYGRVLAFDDRAAEEFATICALRKRAGKRIEVMDGLIAGIVRANRFTLATRDGDFSDCGIDIVDPWTV
jgi:predicted nucleic acid-binding protein